MLFLYYEVTTLISFYPFNHPKAFTLKERLTESLFNGFWMALPPLGYLLKWDHLINASPWIYGGLLIGEFLAWWHPYLWGPTDKWKQVYDRVFKDTHHFLPPRNNHPIPNTEHVVLHGLTLIVFCITLVYYLSLP